MRHRRTVWLLGAWMVAAPLAGQSLDDIVARSIEARGGQEKILALQSVRMTGQMILGESLEAPFSWEWKRPGKFRVELTLQGKTAIQAFDGKQAWMVAPFAGKLEPELLSAEVTRAMASEADFDGHLVNHEAKGHKLSLLPDGEVNGVKVHRVLAELDTGNLFLYSLDAETFLVVQTESRTFLGETQVESVSLFADYRKVGDLLFPYSLEARLKTQPDGRKMTIGEIQIDPVLDDSRFAFPGGDATASTP